MSDPLSSDFSDPSRERLSDNLISLTKRPLSQPERDVVPFLDAILEEALIKEASDIHFHPQHNTIKLRFRIDGQLIPILEIPSEIWQRFCVRLKVLSNLDIAQSRLPQSGHFEQSINESICDFRVSTHPTIFGESMVLRLIRKAANVRTLPQLGFNDLAVKTLTNAVKAPYGLILVCGPTGSGKTTTLYALSSYMDPIKQNIMTLEDPVESYLPGIRQTEINGNFSFSQGMRSILRQDPDIIFIGEIRDEDTAQMALRASMTGRLVLSTLHVPNVFRIPHRLYDLGLSSAQLSGQLLCLVSQRLVRKTCSLCQGKSCQFCQEGLKSRTAIAEVLRINPEIEKALLSNQTDNEILEIAHKYGFQTLYEDGLRKVEQKIIPLAELERIMC